MNNNSSPKPVKSKMIEVILTIATVVVIFITIGLMVAFVENYRDRVKSPYSDSTFRYSLEEGDYGRLVYYIKEAEPYEDPSDGVKKYYGIAQYFYASSMEAIARTMGDGELENYWSGEKASVSEKAAAFPNDMKVIDEKYN